MQEKKFCKSNFKLFIFNDCICLIINHLQNNNYVVNYVVHYVVSLQSQDIQIITNRPLSMDGAKVESTVREILRGYDTGRIFSVARLAAGFANLNYLAETERGKYVVRICRQREAEELTPEIRLAAVLQEHGIPTPQPLAAAGGRKIHSTRQGPALVFPFIEGDHPVPGPPAIRATAHLLARLHTIPPEEVPRKNNSIRPEECRSFIASTPHSCLEERWQRSWLGSFDKAASCLEQDLPRGIIHGDLFPDNILFRNGVPVALLDLEEFAVDTLLFDIGMTINGFCTPGNRPDREAVRLFLAAYEEIRVLTEEEKACLDAWIIWTALGMACWHVRDCNGGEKPSQRSRIRELILLADQWANNTNPIKDHETQSNH